MGLCGLFNSVKAVAQIVETHPAQLTDLTLRDEVRELLIQKLKEAPCLLSFFTERLMLSRGVSATMFMSLFLTSFLIPIQPTLSV